MNRIIETDRIFLRPFCIVDIEPVAKICANPNVMRYIGEHKKVWGNYQRSFNSEDVNQSFYQMVLNNCPTLFYVLNLDRA